MYAVTPATEEAWRALFERIGLLSGVELAYVDHPPPAGLTELWNRPDLGLAFMCGWPFANLYPGVGALAAPVPDAAWAGGSPAYRTDFVVRADSCFRELPDTFGSRIGWTADHSQSGYLAVLEHLSGLNPEEGRALFGTWVGPLVTPRRVVDAVLGGDIEVGPLDAYWRELLGYHEPETGKRLRYIGSTRLRPMPLLIASVGVEPDRVERLRRTLVAISSDALARPILNALRLSGFAEVERADYDVLAGSERAMPGDASSPG